MFIFIARVVIPLSTSREFTTGPPAPRYSITSIIFPVEYRTILYFLIWTHNAPVLNQVTFLPSLHTGILVSNKFFSIHKITYFLGKLISQRVLKLEERD